MVRASFNASYVHLIPCPLHCFPLHNYRTILSTFLRILVHSHLVYVGTTPYSVQPIGPYSIALTIASSGPFRIYRAPGSVAFLSCGSALQPILPKSQCWCLDEDSSRFVLQIRRPQYWRIELPVDEGRPGTMGLPLVRTSHSLYHGRHPPAGNPNSVLGLFLEGHSGAPRLTVLHADQRL